MIRDYVLPFSLQAAELFGIPKIEVAPDGDIIHHEEEEGEVYDDDEGSGGGVVVWHSAGTQPA